MLRDYQRAAAQQCAESLRSAHTLLVLPTGTGKTHTARAICERLWEPGKPVLVVGHTGEIVAQLARSFSSWQVYVEKASERASAATVVRSSYAGPTVLVASLQTLARDYRLEQWRDVEFSARVLDEAHHAPAATWQAVREAIGGFWLGLTATPQRKGMASMWSVVQPFEDLAAAIDAGWLVPLRLRYMMIDDAEREALSRSPSGDVAAARARIARTALQWSQGRQGICFWGNVAAAKAGAQLMHASGVHAVSLDAKSRNRNSAIELYRRGNVRWLHLCGVGVEGLDVVPASALVLASPRRGWQLTQIVGRVLRPLPAAVDGADAEQRRGSIAASAKPDALVLSATSEDDMGAALEAQRLLHGQLPEPKLIQAIQDASVDPETRAAQELLASEVAEAEERRRRGRDQQLQPRRRRELQNARPFEVSGGASALVRGHLRAKWREWSERGRGVEGPRATEKQAAAVGRLIDRALGQPEGITDASAVQGWPRAIAQSAQFYLYKRTS